MCGLVGVVGNIGYTGTKVFHDLIRLDVIRGEDSTGVAVLGQGFQKIIKHLGDPYYLLGTEEYHDHVAASTVYHKNFALLGHNRAATKGDITEDNAHPFRHGSILLTHNGTLHTLWGIEQILPHMPSFGTDSETVCWALSETTISEVWPEVWGGTALVWWDTSVGKLFMVRNDERPLHYAITKDGKTLYYASEAWMLKGVLQRHRVEIEGDKVIAVTPNYLYGFSRQQQGKLAREMHKLETWTVHPRQTTGTTLPLRTPPTQLVTPSNIQAELDFSDLFSETFAKRCMEEQDFYSRYERCCFCDTKLSAEYHFSVVLSPYEATCGDCAEQAFDETFHSMGNIK